MKIAELSRRATKKENFRALTDYIDFSVMFQEMLKGDSVQARIVARNESNYQFFQYKDSVDFAITRPINSNIFLESTEFSEAVAKFPEILSNLKSSRKNEDDTRSLFTKMIYTVQQSIGASLDALPAAETNTARKVNGDLFERFIRILFEECGISCTSATLKVPITDSTGTEFFKMSYQHDLVFGNEGQIKMIGSVKTSSKDRIDKIFLDKFLFTKLTESAIPHIGIFLNDVQRKGTEPNYGVNSTFLSGHFIGYSLKLNPLDGVYYCDLRPNMKSDAFLSSHISTIDKLFFDDLPVLLSNKGLSRALIEQSN